MKAPPQPANVSITQGGNESSSRLVSVAQAAFKLALQDQEATAVGINFVASIPLPESDVNRLLQGLLNPAIAERDTGRSGGILVGGGIKLIYDKRPWLATVSIDSDPKNKTQVVCSVNFNIDNPPKGKVTLIQEADKLRAWFEQTVGAVVGEN